MQLKCPDPFNSFNKIFISRNKIFAETTKILFFLKDKSKTKRIDIDIYNENDGLFQSSFNLEDSFKMVAISNETSEIITYSSVKSIIRVYKIDGTIVGELDVSQFSRIHHVCIHESGKIVIIDKRSNKIFSN